ncbi:MAG: hypothetical protein R2822_21190 [Spirosomataceae bacterium]
MKNNFVLSTVIFFFFLVLLGGEVSCKSIAPTTLNTPTNQEVVKDSIAERMLLYQRNNGGWPQPGGNPINYNQFKSYRSL